MEAIGALTDILVSSIKAGRKAISRIVVVDMAAFSINNEYTVSDSNTTYRMSLATLKLNEEMRRIQ